MSLRRGTWTDVGVILLVMATTLSIFDDTFADRSYLVAGMVPVVLLLVMALFSVQLDEGGWWYGLVALVVFSPLGALVALREPGPYLVPTIDTMSGLLAGAAGAPTTLVSTVPPVDPTGVVMLVPFMIGFLATLPAAWFALGTTRPFAPVFPLVLGLAATIPVGVLVPSLLVPRGVVVATLLVAWGTQRARRREGSAGVSRESLLGAMTAVVTVALMSGVVVLLVPDDNESDRVLLRGDDNTPLVAGAGASLLQSEREGFKLLFKASGVPDGRRLRFAVLDLYDGEQWVPAEESPGSEGYGTFKRIGPEVASLHTGRTVVVRVRMQAGYVSDWLPLLGELTSIDLDWNPGLTAVSDLRYNQATGSAIVVGGVGARDAYSFESVLPDDTFTRRDPTRDPVEEQRQPAGASIDDLLRPFQRDELLPLERVLLLARYLRETGVARKGLDVAQSPDDLGRGMLGSRRMSGTPYQYSALMALGASRLGVPARLVTGAEVGPRGLVHNVDVESWVELQFADGTWRSLDPRRYVGSRSDGPSTEAEDLPPADQFVKDQIARATQGRDREIRPPKGSSNPDGTPVDEPRPAWQVALLVMGVIAVALLVALPLVPVIKAVRRRRRRRTSSWSRVYVNGWQEVLDAARDRGTPVPETWSRLAQASALGSGTELARRADAAVFAPVAPDDDVQDFWSDCLVLRRALLDGTDRRHRWWALVNPASLVAGWARGRGADHPTTRQARHVRA